MKNPLYLGLDPTRFPHPVTHYPIIEIRELDATHHFKQLELYETVIFTSRTAVKLYAQHTKIRKPCIVVGKATAELASQLGFTSITRAKLEQAEGVLDLLRKDGSYFFGHSAKARRVLIDYLADCHALTFSLYETVVTSKRIDIAPYDVLIFTSPSTVEAFCELYGAIPSDKEIVAIGPITEKALGERGQGQNVVIVL